MSVYIKLHIDNVLASWRNDAKLELLTYRDLYKLDNERCEEKRFKRLNLAAICLWFEYQSLLVSEEYIPETEHAIFKDHELELVEYLHHSDHVSTVHKMVEIGLSYLQLQLVCLSKSISGPKLRKLEITTAFGN